MIIPLSRGSSDEQGTINMVFTFASFLSGGAQMDHLLYRLRLPVGVFLYL